MKDPIGEFLVGFVGRHHGVVKKLVAGALVQAEIPFTSRKRLCVFNYSDNPIRTIVTIGKMPEDSGTFVSLLNEADENDEFTHQMLFTGGMMYWTFDVLLPEVPIEQMFSLWMQLAVARVRQIDAVIIVAEGESVVNGKFISPMESSTVN